MHAAKAGWDHVTEAAHTTARRHLLLWGRLAQGPLCVLPGAGPGLRRYGGSTPHVLKADLPGRSLCAWCGRLKSHGSVWRLLGCWPRGVGASALGARRFSPGRASVKRRVRRAGRPPPGCALLLHRCGACGAKESVRRGRLRRASQMCVESYLREDASTRGNGTVSKQFLSLA